MKTAILCALAFLCACSGGPDPVRIRQERAVHALAKRAFDGWFQGLPFTPDDAQRCYSALEDWENALRADEALLANPAGEVGR